MPSSFRLNRTDKLKAEKIAKRGSTPTRVSLRCRILLLAHSGKSHEEIAQHLDCGSATAKRVRRHYREEGLERAIYDAPRSGRPAKHTTREDKELIALACSTPPDGHSRWTIRLLAAKTKRSYGSVRQVLQEDGLKPWREKNVVRSRNHS